MKPGSLQTEFTQVGVIAISAFGSLLVVSLRPVRKFAYEFFFFLHFLMVLCVQFPLPWTSSLTPVFIVLSSSLVTSTPRSLSKWCTSRFMILGLFTSTFRVGYWFEVSFLIWGLDRFFRLVRLIAFNHSYFGFKKGSGTMDATIEPLSPNLVCLRLRRPSHFEWSPGQTAYLTMPGVSTIPFEAHPFTIASIDTTRDDTQGGITPITNKESFAGTGKPCWKELVFFINVHGGFTKKLGNAAQKGEKVKVFVDGPYGKSPDLKDYETSVLIAGGSGVSFTLPLFLDCIRWVPASHAFGT